MGMSCIWTVNPPAFGIWVSAEDEWAIEKRRNVSTSGLSEEMGVVLTKTLLDTEQVNCQNSKEPANHQPLPSSTSLGKLVD